MNSVDIVRTHILNGLGGDIHRLKKAMTLFGWLTIYWLHGEYIELLSSV